MGIAVGPVMTATREQPHGLAVPAHDQPISVVLDLVHPVWPRRRPGGGANASGPCCENNTECWSHGAVRLPRGCEPVHTSRRKGGASSNGNDPVRRLGSSGAATQEN